MEKLNVNSPSSKENLRKELQELQSLFKDGLIDDSEYKQKKQQLLGLSDISKSKDISESIRGMLLQPDVGKFPSIDEMKDFLKKLPVNKIPLDQLDYERVEQLLSNQTTFNDYFTLNNHSHCRDLVYSIPLKIGTGNLHNTEASFISLYDRLILETAQYFKCSTSRGTNFNTSTNSDQPDAVVYYNDLPLLRGEEKKDTKQNPGKDLTDKLMWSFEGLPYIFGYYSERFHITFCILTEDCKRTDILKFDLRQSFSRLLVWNAVRNIIRLFPLMVEHFTGTIPLLISREYNFQKYKTIEQAKLKDTLLIHVCKTWFVSSRYTKDDLNSLKEHMIMLDELMKEIPFVEHIIDSTPATLKLDRLYIRYSPLGERKRPSSETELTECLKCIVSTLVLLHKQNIIHRDIRFENIVYFKGEWYLIDFEDAAYQPSPSSTPKLQQFKKEQHAPELFLSGVTHDCKVDIWSIGHLISSSIKNGSFRINEKLRDLSVLLLDSDPQKRPTAESLLSLLSVIC